VEGEGGGDDELEVVPSFAQTHEAQVKSFCYEHSTSDSDR
jgi:hypothetical protein